MPVSPPNAEPPSSGLLSPRSVQALPWLVLVLCLGLTIWAWSTIKERATEESDTRFAYRTHQIEEALRGRLQTYRLALQSGAALFAASREVSREEWRRFVEALDLSRNYPGIQGMGYALRVPDDQRETIIRTVRAEGYPGFSLWPAGERDDHTGIIYLEPLTGRNLRAFGYDMYSEPVRRRAMATARDTGEPSLSGKVTLVQETGTEVQAGFLFYVPVYRNGAETDTVEQRRAALVGWVYAPFRMGDFMAGLLGSGPVLMNDVDLEVFDGEEQSSHALMWDYDESGRWRQTHRPTYAKDVVLRTDHHAWTLHLAATPAFRQHTVEANLTLLAGLAGSLLVFAFMKTLASTRTRALDLAREMTSALALSEERYREMFINNQAIKLLIDPEDMRIVDANPAAANYYGYPLEQLREMRITDLNTLPPEEVALEAARARKEERRHFNFRHRLASGDIRDVEVYSGPVQTRGHVLLYSIIHDVTERNRVQAEQRAILETALVGIALVRERRIVWANSGMANLFGYPRKEIRGIETAHLYAAMADHENLGHEAYPALGEGHTYETELLMRRRDGSTFWCHLSGRMIDVERPELGSIWTFNDIDAAVQAKAQLIALNKQLRDQAQHDPLTGLFNRRHLEEALSRDIRLAERKDRKLALIMLDIDHFKQFNDRFGHDAGDHVLRHIAAMLIRQTRETDTVCRYGGEEFLVLMPETDLDTAMQRAEALREAAQSLLLDYQGRPLGAITISLGVAIYPDHAGNCHELIAAADSALYRAKQNGRNRVERAGP